MDDQNSFLQLLAKQINGGSDKFTFDGLKKCFLEAVDDLPEGNLKGVLQKQSEQRADHIWRLIKPARKCSGEVEFNIFSPDSLEETLNKVLQHHSNDEQMKYLSQAALCNPSNKIYELLLMAQKNKSPDICQHDILSKVTELYGRLTVGCKNLEVLSDQMKTFLSEIDKINDKFRTSNEASDSWLDLKDIVHCFLIHCHIKRKTQEGCCKDEIKEWTEYRDCLAAIIAIYIDVIIAIGERNEDVSNHISNVVYLLLGDSPSHILDSVNQIVTLDSDKIKIIFPFLRKVFETTKFCTTKYPNYLKYVCLAWKIQKCAGEEEMAFLRKSVYSLLSPENFLCWLADIDNRLLQDFGLSGFVRQKITQKILQCEDEETVEKLLDLASSPEKWSEIENGNENKDEEEMDETNDVLFFVDAQGSSELLEQCQEQEFTSSRSDKILRSQITALLEKREEAGSENEQDDFDISLDGKETETTFEFDFADSEPKNTDDIPDQPFESDGGTEKEMEDEDEPDLVPTPKENLEKSKKKRRKRKSQSLSAVSDEEKGKSLKKKVLKKRRSLSKTI